VVSTIGTTLFCFILRVAWVDRAAIRADTLELFSVLFICLFIAENLFAGGGIPFYERYVFNLAFFLYYLLFRRAPPIKNLVLAACLIWVIAGQVSLWKNRYATHNQACSLQWPSPATIPFPAGEHGKLPGY